MRSPPPSAATAHRRRSSTTENQSSGHGTQVEEIDLLHLLGSPAFHLHAATVAHGGGYPISSGRYPTRSSAATVKASEISRPPSPRASILRALLVTASTSRLRSHSSTKLRCSRPPEIARPTTDSGRRSRGRPTSLRASV